MKRLGMKHLSQRGSKEKPREIFPYLGRMVVERDYDPNSYLYKCEEHGFIGDAPGCVNCLQDRITQLDKRIAHLEKDKAELADVQKYWVTRCKVAEKRVRELMRGSGMNEEVGSS